MTLGPPCRGHPIAAERGRAWVVRAMSLNWEFAEAAVVTSYGLLLPTGSHPHWAVQTPRPTPPALTDSPFLLGRAPRWNGHLHQWLSTPGSLSLSLSLQILDA